MKIWKSLIIGAMCLSLTVPAAFAEETANAVDAATSATQQQENRDRGGKQQPDTDNVDQAPEKNGLMPGKDSRHRQKPGRNGQMQEEQVPDQGTQIPGRDSHAQDAGTPDPGTEGQRKNSGGKNGRKVLPGRQEESRNTDLQSGDGLPETPGAGMAGVPESADALADMLRVMEEKIKELKSLLEALNGSTASE